MGNLRILPIGMDIRVLCEGLRRKDIDIRHREASTHASLHPVSNLHDNRLQPNQQRSLPNRPYHPLTNRSLLFKINAINDPLSQA